jgi:hypothetical protein
VAEYLKDIGRLGVKWRDEHNELEHWNHEATHTYSGDPNHRTAVGRLETGARNIAAFHKEIIAEYDTGLTR